MFTVVLIVYYQISAHWFLIRNFNEIFSHSILCGFVFILITEINLLVESYSIQFVTVMCIVTSAIILSYTFIMFVRLRQVNQIIYAKKFNIFELNRFIQYHTATILVILRSNKFYGRILLSFIINQVTINTYLLILMIIGQFGTFGSLIFGNLIFCQNLPIFVFHMLGAMFTKRIHRCRKPLFNWSAGHTINRLHFVPMSSHLRLWSYLMKFNTPSEGQYGLTYGNDINLITSLSFIKV